MRFWQGIKRFLDIKSYFSFLVCVAICSLAGLLSGWHWFFDLFNHFRPQAILAGVLLIIPAIFFKDKTSIVLALTIIALNGIIVAERIYAFGNPKSSSHAGESSRPFSIISANVLTSNREYAATRDLILKQQPDIFVAIEVDDAWIKALEPIEMGYPYAVKHPRPDNFGIAVYAKMPFKAKVLNIGEYELPLMQINFESFVLLAAHPPPPMRVESSQIMSLYISRIIKAVEETDMPLVIAGDLNTTLWSNNVRAYIPLKLKPANPFGFVWTWPSGFLPFAMQIDHIFTRDAVIHDFEVLENIGSDHFPIKVELGIQKLEGSQ